LLRGARGVYRVHQRVDTIQFHPRITLIRRIYPVEAVSQSHTGQRPG
jgi:hypothetical protein